jgi:hypothetical protein
LEAEIVKVIGPEIDKKMAAAYPKMKEITDDQVAELGDIVSGEVQDVLDDHFEDEVGNDVESLGVREELQHLQKDIRSLKWRINKFSFVKKEKSLQPLDAPDFGSLWRLKSKSQKAES